MLSAILTYAAITGVAIWLPRKENTQGLPATTEEKLRFTIGNVIMLIIVGVVVQVG